MRVARVSYLPSFDPTFQKMVKHTLKTFQQMMQDFQAVFSHLVETRYIWLTNINYLPFAREMGILPITIKFGFLKSNKNIDILITT